MGVFYVFSRVIVFLPPFRGLPLRHLEWKLELPSKFRSEKSRGNDSEWFSLVRGKKCSFCGISCFSKGSISQFGIERNETEFREIIKFYQAANKRGIFRVFSVPKNGLNRIFECFLFRELVRNGIPKFFLFENGSEWNSEVCFLFRKWFGTEFQAFSLPKMVQNGIPRFFSSENGTERNSKGFYLPRRWFGTEFRDFFLPRNRRNSNGTAVCSVLFRIPRNNFFVGKGKL